MLFMIGVLLMAAGFFVAAMIMDKKGKKLHPEWADEPDDINVYK